MFSLEVVACMGACGLAPVVNINGQFYAKVSPMKLQRIIEACREKEHDPCQRLRPASASRTLLGHAGPARRPNCWTRSRAARSRPVSGDHARGAHRRAAPRDRRPGP